MKHGDEMMEQVIEAIYEQGLLRPLAPLNLPEHQRVTLKIYALNPEAADNILAQMKKVYEGLSDQDIAEIEAIALDRLDFFDKHK